MVRILERALNSAQVSRKGLSTSPHARKSQVVGSNSGTEPECRTGHFKVSDCPGGSLPSSFIWRSRCLRSSITSLQGEMLGGKTRLPPAGKATVEPRSNSCLRTALADHGRKQVGV